MAPKATRTIEKEEDMFAKAQKTEIDFDALGKKMLGRKEELLSQGMPDIGESDMVAKSEGKGDSPAKAARHPVAPRRRLLRLRGESWAVAEDTKDMQMAGCRVTLTCRQVADNGWTSWAFSAAASETTWKSNRSLRDLFPPAKRRKRTR